MGFNDSINLDLQIMKRPFVEYDPKLQKERKDKVKKERDRVILLWNAGKNYREMAEELNCPIQRIEKHMKKNEVIYGAEAVRARALTLELPEP